MLNLGLIGAGGIARAHLEAVDAHPELMRLVAVADPVEASAHAAAETRGSTVYRDYHDLLADPAVDAVDICLPHHLHAEAILAATAAGKHILCEKPLCLNEDEAQRITDAVRATGVVLMCGHNQLFQASIAKAKELIDADKVGRIFEIRTNECFSNSFTPESAGWRADPHKSGGGDLIDSGYHPAYLMLHLVGSRPTDVAAFTAQHAFDFLAGEDTAALLVRFENGALGTLITTWAYSGPDANESFSVVGSKGTVSGDARIVRYRPASGGETTLYEPEPVHTWTAQLEHFAHAIRDHSRPIHNEADGIMVLRLILAAYESARTGRIIPIGQG